MTDLENLPRDNPVNVLFRNLVPSRECGDCVACCHILHIEQPELVKPADTLCPHNTGKGCGIYDARPNVCRGWYCLWRRIDALPEECRPDRINVVFSIDRHRSPRIPFERLYIVGRTLTDPSAFEEPKAQAVIRMFADEGTLPVWLSHEGMKHMIHPHPPLADAIMNPTTTPFQHYVPAALAWSKRYDTICSVLD